MNTIQNSLTATAIAAALSLSLSGVAVAEVSPAAQKADALMLATNDRMDEAGDAVSDTWITTKVKSTLLAEDATPGMDIEVETKDGVVSLSGTVATEAEREVAISKAKGIKGVREVSADGLKTVD
ncbi:MAG: BON domain-containing protein [Pseudomonas stutzeri]|uniref:BON domain-containing protein n=1 Tax=Stutzerimonas stutzeri TaxID=316 RepID=UPI0021099AFA|nr:BON domain-containing protein [Stutzerimonas stutzeri]MBF6623327.1 BON domain-containing protein [Stutzerimonas stutzeri]MCQ4241614.1 BON domain-containing protein [Stutzerimonas stutzeri]